jgi:hypothetical protein
MQLLLEMTFPADVGVLFQQTKQPVDLNTDTCTHALDQLTPRLYTTANADTLKSDERYATGKQFQVSFFFSFSIFISSR